MGIHGGERICWKAHRWGWSEREVFSTALLVRIETVTNHRQPNERVTPANQAVVE